MSHVLYKCLGVFFFSLFFSISVSGATIVKSLNNNGLVGYWSFNDATSTRATDFSGRSNHGTLTNIATPATASSGWGAGKFGGGINFDGSNDYVVAPHSSSLNISGQITMSAWVNVSGFPSPHTDCGFNSCASIIEKGYDGTTESYFLRFQNENGTIRIYSGSYQVPTPYDVSWNVSGINTNEWHHIVGLYDGTNWKIYVDGVEKASTPKASGAVTNTKPFNVGMADINGSLERFFNGKIDEVRIYNRALSAPEISALYQSGLQKINSSQKDKVTNGLVSYWTFDGADLSGTLAYDRAGSNNGTLTNGPTRSLGRIGQSLNFDYVDDYISIPNGGFSSLFSGSITAWINPQTFPGGSIVATFTNSGTNRQFPFGVVDSGSGTTFKVTVTAVYAAGSLGFVCSTTNNFSYNDWYSVAYTTTNGSGTFNIYVNGVNQAYTCSLGSATDFFYGDTMSGGDILQIGAKSDDNFTHASFFKGRIDDVRIYSRSLTQAEINQLYAMGAGVKVNAPQANLNGSTLQTGLVGLWSFNGNDFTDKVYDRSGQANDGYVVGAATSTVKTIGKAGQGARFDGVDDYINFGDVLNSLSQISFSYWFYLNANGVNGTSIPISKSSVSSASYRFQGANAFIIQTTNNVWFSAGTIASGGVTDIGRWIHVVGTYDGSFVRLYNDGVLVGTGAQAISGSIYSTTNPVRLGYKDAPNTDYCNCKIDEVRVYNRALSAPEIKQLYNLGK